MCERMVSAHKPLQQWDGTTRPPPVAPFQRPTRPPPQKQRAPRRQALLLPTVRVRDVRHLGKKKGSRCAGNLTCCIDWAAHLTQLATRSTRKTFSCTHTCSLAHVHPLQLTLLSGDSASAAMGCVWWCNRRCAWLPRSSSTTRLSAARSPKAQHVSVRIHSLLDDKDRLEAAQTNEKRGKSCSACPLHAASAQGNYDGWRPRGYCVWRKRPCGPHQITPVDAKVPHNSTVKVPDTHSVFYTCRRLLLELRRITAANPYACRLTCVRQQP